MAAHQPRRRPLPKGDAFFTPGATGMRREIERRSAAPLVFLHGLPRWILPVALLAAGPDRRLHRAWPGRVCRACRRRSGSRVVQLPFVADARRAVPPAALRDRRGGARDRRCPGFPVRSRACPVDLGGCGRHPKPAGPGGDPARRCSSSRSRYWFASAAAAYPATPPVVARAPVRAARDLRATPWARTAP